MVSVIIPCYNCVSFVRRAINSVLNQTFQDYELLLIDNRSTDGTLQLLHSFLEQYPSRIAIYSENKAGAPAARNHGLAMARGEWIQFLDADDELHPEKLARQIELVQGRQTGVVIGNYIIEREQGRLRENRYGIKDPWKGLIVSDLGVTSSNMWKKEDLVAVNGWNEDMTSSQEYELMFRLLKNGSTFLFDTSFSTTVHRKGNSVSRSTDKRKLTEILKNRIKLRYEIKDYLKNTGQLTRELSTMIDTYIYMELKSNYRAVPDYAEMFMQQNALQVPFEVVLKTNARLKLKEWFPFLSRS